MTRQDVLNEIRMLEERKKQVSQDLQKQKEVLDALKDFRERCAAHAKAFSYSVQRRRTRLSAVDNLVDTVKAAAAYRAKMGEMLNGTEYQKTTAEIEMLEKSVESEIQNTLSKIADHEREIQQMQARIDSLKYQLSIIPEERGNE